MFVNHCWADSYSCFEPWLVASSMRFLMLFVSFLSSCHKSKIFFLEETPGRHSGPSLLEDFFQWAWSLKIIVEDRGVRVAQHKFQWKAHRQYRRNDRDHKDTECQDGKWMNEDDLEVLLNNSLWFLVWKFFNSLFCPQLDGCGGRWGKSGWKKTFWKISTRGHWHWTVVFWRDKSRHDMWKTMALRLLEPVLCSQAESVVGYKRRNFEWCVVELLKAT